MRITIRVIGIVLLCAITFFGIVMAASESGEVVILSTIDESGNTIDTRLWVVDHDGAQWVRAGQPEKGWFRRLEANSRVKLLREGSMTDRIAVPVRDQSIINNVNKVFSEKYGIADRIVALPGDASKRVPVRLDEI